MENVYEVMWDNHKTWIINAIGYYSNQMRTVDKDSYEYSTLEHQVASFQFQLDKLEGDERIYALDIRDYKEEMNSGE